MRTIYFLLFCFVAALSSCSSAYKTAQTPDDVYYSPGRQTNRGYVNNNQQDEYYNANPSDQYVVMRVQNPARWSTFDNYDYSYGGGYSPYSSFGSGYGGYGMYSAYSPWISFGYWNPYYGLFNSYYNWNSFYNPYYNPYCGGVIVGSTKYPVAGYATYAQLHPFSAGSYTNNSLNTNNAYYGRNTTTSPTRSSRMVNNYSNLYNNNNRNNNYSRSPNNNSNFRSSNSQPTRSYSPSSFGGGNSGGGSRSFARPGKG